VHCRTKDEIQLLPKQVHEYPHLNLSALQQVNIYNAVGLTPNLILQTSENGKLTDMTPRVLKATKKSKLCIFIYFVQN